MKILITGFEPFGGESVNPAYEAVKLLPDMAGDIQIVKMEIPTVFGRGRKSCGKGVARLLDVVLALAGGKASRYRSGACCDQPCRSFNSG